MPTLLPATVLARVFRGEPARAMFGGVAPHAFRPLNRPMSSAIGLAILTAGHRSWAVAAGGSRAITAAMAELSVELGGEIETGFAEYNSNFVGAHILIRSKDPRQLVFGPRARLDPYRVGPPWMFTCSAATPPGPGAHGMCGANAAASALRHLRR